MASVTGMTTSFRSDILGAVHNLTANTIKFALFDSSAAHNSATTRYFTDNEVSGTGYSAGGATIASQAVSSNGSSGIFDGDDPEWTGATFTANSGMLYNDTLAGKNTIANFDFGGSKTVSNGTFTVQFPAPVAGSALVEIDDA